MLKKTLYKMDVDTLISKGFLILDKEHILYYKKPQWVVIERPTLSSKGTIQGSRSYYTSLEQLFKNMLSLKITAKLKKNLEMTIEQHKKIENNIMRKVQSLEEYCRTASVELLNFCKNYKEE